MQTISISSLIVIGFVGLSFAAFIFYTAYDLGRTKEQNEQEKQKTKSLLQARKLRDSLCDADVVERLHNTFKR